MSRRMSSLRKLKVVALLSNSKDLLEAYNLESKLESAERELSSLKAQSESLKTQLTSSEKKVMILLQRSQGISGLFSVEGLTYF
jgi:chromosome segregation ATPase